MQSTRCPGHRRSAPRFIAGARLLLLIALLLTGWLGLPAGSRAQAAISVVNSTAEANFPFSISFSLTAQSNAGEINHVELLYGEARSEILTVVELEVRPGERVEVRHEIDTQVYYSPPGTELRYRWLIRDSAGNQLETPPVNLTYHDQRFNWSERSARNVTVFWYEGGDQFGDELMATTEEALDKLQQVIGAELEQSVKIYIYANNSDMRSALQSNEVEWVGGQANPTLGIIVAAIPPGNSAEVQRIIPHELSHQVLHQATENPYGGMPFWFDEGLAVYNQTTVEALFPELVDDAAAGGSLIPLEALSSSFPADPGLAYQSYAQSWSVVAYIIDTYGPAKMQELAAAFRDATPLEEALQNVLGLGIDELDAAWRATLPPQTSEPQATSGPLRAPADRFSDTPVANTPPVVDQPADQPAGLFAWLESLPAWGLLTLTVLFCGGIIGLLGITLLVVLRLVGVDKRAS